MAYQKSPLLCAVWSSLLFVAMFSTRVVMVSSMEGPTFPWKGPPRAFCWNCKVRSVVTGWRRHFLAIVRRCLVDVERVNPRDVRGRRCGVAESSTILGHDAVSLSEWFPRRFGRWNVEVVLTLKMKALRFHTKRRILLAHRLSVTSQHRIIRTPTPV